MAGEDRTKNAGDLTGMRFGRYTVLGSAGRRSGRLYWHCRCDCGNERDVENWHLKSGHTQSCGCLRRETLSARNLDLTGERYGRLTVIGPAKSIGEERGNGKDGAGVWWECICDCGRRCVCRKEHLRSGRTRSCGCICEEQRRENIAAAIHFVDGTCIERISSDRTASNNTSGRRGVYRRGNGKWRALIGFQGRVINLGTYPSFEEASAARKEAEEKIYKPFLEQHQIKV